MSTELGEMPPMEDPQGLGLLSIDTQHVQCFDDLFKSASRYLRLPGDNNQELLQTSAQELTKVTRSAFEAIVCGEGTVENKAEMIATLLMDDDVKRTECFAELTGQYEKFKVDSTTRDRYVEVTIEHLSTEGAGVDTIMQYYTHNFQIDLNSLLECADKSRNGRFLAIGKQAANHALDVAKITAGVVIGIGIAKRLKK